MGGFVISPEDFLKQEEPSPFAVSPEEFLRPVSEMELERWARGPARLFPETKPLTTPLEGAETTPAKRAVMDVISRATEIAPPPIPAAPIPPELAKPPVETVVGRGGAELGKVLVPPEGEMRTAMRPALTGQIPEGMKPPESTPEAIGMAIMQVATGAASAESLVTMLGGGAFGQAVTKAANLPRVARDASAPRLRSSPRA